MCSKIQFKSKTGTSQDGSLLKIITSRKEWPRNALRNYLDTLVPTNMHGQWTCKLGNVGRWTGENMCNRRKS